MDFVVVGFGVGALGVLLGALLRGWLAGRCERAAARAVDSAAAAYERASAAECRGAGQAFLAAGGAVVLATVGGLVGALDDRSGALLVTTTATVAALGIILWGYLYRARNPMLPRPRRHAALADPTTAQEIESDFVIRDPAVGPALAVMRDAGAPDDDEDAAETDSPEPDIPISAKRATPQDSAAVEVAPEAADTATDEPMRQDGGGAANGHPADDAIADTARIVAFVGGGARAGAEGTSVSDDEEESDEP